MQIERPYYLNKLIRAKHNQLVKVITGIRRCGKSFLLNNLFYNHLISCGVENNHIISYSFDELEQIDLLNPVRLLQVIKDRIVDEEMYYIILDEIQMVPNFEKVLTSLNHISNTDVYVTGSNSKFLSSDIITEFRGRGDEIQVHPFSFSEYYSAVQGDIQKAWFEYYTYGGMPFLIHKKEYEDKSSYLKSIYEKVYRSDILNRFKIRNKEELYQILQVLSSAVGSLTNSLNLAKSFQHFHNHSITDKTIVRYISYLEDAFLISKAQRYNIKGKKYVRSTEKFYFEDVGIRNAMLNFRQIEENHLMENIIYNELKMRGFNVDIGVVEKIETTKDKKKVRKKLEIDFVASKADNCFYIQSAFHLDTPEKKEQELKSLMNIPDHFKKIVIVKDYMPPTKNQDGITIMGITNFLLNDFLTYSEKV